MALALSALITNVDAEANCNTAANKQCCWVRKMYSGLGGEPKFISNTGCCHKNGVSCNVNGKVTAVSWNRNRLSNAGSFPSVSAIQNLPNLTKM